MKSGVTFSRVNVTKIGLILHTLDVVTRCMTSQLIWVYASKPFP